MPMDVLPAIRGWRGPRDREIKTYTQFFKLLFTIRENNSDVRATKGLGERKNFYYIVKIKVYKWRVQASQN